MKNRLRQEELTSFPSAAANKKGEGCVPFTLLRRDISPAYFKQPKLLPENLILKLS
jgi:hypothetical protein